MYVRPSAEYSRLVFASIVAIVETRLYRVLCQRSFTKEAFKELTAYNVVPTGHGHAHVDRDWDVWSCREDEFHCD